MVSSELFLYSTFTNGRAFVNKIMMSNHIFFTLGLSFILLHEMDAIRCREWRIFPGLSTVDDALGFKIFTLAHIPLFLLLFGGLLASKNESLIYGLNVFFIIHCALHILFLRHKNNEFKDWISWTIISGAALFGMLDLILN